MQNIKAKAVHDLICGMLRGPHIRTMAGGDLPHYLYKAGVALHNLPFAITGEQPLSEGQLRDINELDPNSSGGGWGPWAAELAAAFGYPLSPSTDQKRSQN